MITGAKVHLLPKHQVIRLREMTEDELAIYCTFNFCCGVDDPGLQEGTPADSDLYGVPGACACADGLAESVYFGLYPE